MLSETEFREAADLLSGWRRPLLLTHARPDGDALGSLLALDSVLRGLGADPLPIVFEGLPDRYRFMPGIDRLVHWSPQVSADMLGDVDSVIVLDTCTYTQLRPIADWLRSATQPKLAIDHHVSRDDLADHYLVDESAAANCLILFEWAKAVGWSLEAPACDALFTGIATDTGWFGHSNTDHRVLSAAADLSARGVRPYDLRRQLYQHSKPGPIRLLGTALTRMRLTANDRVAVMTLPLEAFRQARALPGDTEDLIDQPMRIGSVAVAVLLVEQEDGITRVSFRSKPPTDGVAIDVDVASVAEAFGGGGHRRAAGARVDGLLADVRERIIKHLELVVR